MKFVYIGSEIDPPTETVVFGHRFTLNGPAVDVTDPEAIAKLKNNRTFKAAGSSAPMQSVRLPDDIAAEVDPVRVLEAAGVKVDGRWGEARIKAELEALNGSNG